MTFFFLLNPWALSGQPAPLDSTFGINGIVSFQYGFSSLLRDMELLPDGKILIAGGSPSEIYLARFNPDGSMDNSFGVNGISVNAVTENVAPHGDLVVQPDGKIISIGEAIDIASPFQTRMFAVFRYNPNGVLDSTFGQSGMVTTKFSQFYASGFIGALQPDGKILAVGQANLGSGLRFAWARYHPEGKIDSTFSDNGYTTLPTGGNGLPTCTVVLADGKILTGGTEVINGTRFLINRLLPNGIVDSTFGVNGKFSEWFGNYYEVVQSMAILPDGKILGAGWVGGGPGGGAVFFRLSPNGSLDPTFGNNGLLIINSGGVSTNNEIDLMPNGKIVATGAGHSPSVGADVAYVMRFHPNGSFDNSFNSTGLGTIIAGTATGGDNQIIQPDGKILISGYYYPSDTLPPQIMLARVLNDGLNAAHAPTFIRQCSISPNPSKGLVTLRYEIERPLDISIKIYDMSGRCALTVVTQKNCPTGENIEYFDTSRLPSGHYQIMIESQLGATSLQLVK
ncbi:MAG: T9SS type A sorting domain-containing protein [Saprospiraceae bacterium]